MTADGKRTVIDPRSAVLRWYGQAFDRLAELEQVSVALGEYDRAQDEHLTGILVLRAYESEMIDEQPLGLE